MSYSTFVILILRKIFACPSGKLSTEFTSPIAKSTSPGLSDTTFFARCTVAKNHNLAIDVVLSQKIQNQNLDLRMDFNNSFSGSGSQGSSLASVLYEHENWLASYIGNKNKPTEIKELATYPTA